MLLNPNGGGQAGVRAQPTVRAAAPLRSPATAARTGGVAKVSARLQAPAKPKPTVGSAKVAKPAATPGPTFTKDASYLQAKNTASLAMSDYDAAAKAARQNQVTENDYQQGLLRTQLGNTQSATAEDYASRGIIRSGAYLGAQDATAATAAQQGSAISQQLTDLDRNARAGRQELKTTNRGALDKVLLKLQSSYYAGQRKKQ